MRAGTGTSRAGFEDPRLPSPNQGEPAIIVLHSPGDVAREAADRIAAALVAGVETRGRADFLTTGGSTVLAIYQQLASSPHAEAVPWRRVHVWWGDDRFVPRGHPESNVTPLDLVLGGQDGVPLPASNAHPFPVAAAMARGNGPEWCAAAYADEMAGNLRIGAGGWPVFDLAIVGVGSDAHLLSCFPGSPALDTFDWTLAIPAPAHIGPHIERMTVNPRFLEASPSVAITTGSGKAEAIGRVFGEVRDERRWPAQRLRRPGAAWLLDEAAAARIGRSRD